MVWYLVTHPLVFPTRWTLLVVTLGGAPMCLCGAGVGIMERSYLDALKMASSQTIPY